MALLIDVHDRVALLTLSDPERKNALTLPMVDEIVAAVERLERDDSIGALVLTGAGSVFCAGADTNALGRMASPDANDDDRASVARVYEGFLRVLRSSLPTVAAVNGAAVGAGFNLALACDVRIAARSARFDARFLRIGLHPGGGHLWLLERAVGPQAAAAITLFGAALDGDAARAQGLAWSCVDDDAVVAQAVAFAQRAASAPKALVERAKSTLRAAPWQPDFDAAVETEFVHQTWSFQQGWFPGR